MLVVSAQEPSIPRFDPVLSRTGDADQQGEIRELRHVPVCDGCFWPDHDLGGRTSTQAGIDGKRLCRASHLVERVEISLHQQGAVRGWRDIGAGQTVQKSEAPDGERQREGPNLSHGEAGQGRSQARHEQTGQQHAAQVSDLNQGGGQQRVAQCAPGKGEGAQVTQPFQDHPAERQAPQPPKEGGEKPSHKPPQSGIEAAFKDEQHRKQQHTRWAEQRGETEGQERQVEAKESCHAPEQPGGDGERVIRGTGPQQQRREHQWGHCTPEGGGHRQGQHSAQQGGDQKRQTPALAVYSACQHARQFPTLDICTFIQVF